MKAIILLAATLALSSCATRGSVSEVRAAAGELRAAVAALDLADVAIQERVAANEDSVDALSDDSQALRVMVLSALHEANAARTEARSNTSRVDALMGIPMHRRQVEAQAD